MADDVSNRCDDTVRWLCEQVIKIAGDNQELADLLAWAVNRPLQILIILTVTLVVLRIAKRWIRAGVERLVVGAPGVIVCSPGTDDSLARRERAAARSTSIGSALSGALAVVVWTMSVITVLGVAGLDIAPLIAGAGIAGVALGFGAQSLVRDVLAGLFILFEDQYGIGDVIEVDGVSGTVEALSLRATQVRSVNGTLWFVPNGQITQLGNMTKSWSAAILDVDVAYGADIDRVREVLAATAQQVADDPQYASSVVDAPQIMGIEALGADAVSVRVLMKVSPGQQWALQRVLRERVKAALGAEGIEIPFPQRTVWLRSEPE
jgi:small conductance mechanosensitive channel